jgi:2-desacetyl-2-hydroxyethyl bacteriochlorophyllide A dehydrogenase
MSATGTRTKAARGLWFTAARHAELLDEEVPAPRDDQVTVRAIVSMVSAGTEMLIYRGQIPAEDDLGLETCAGTFGFPVKYAYQVVGEVVDAGASTEFQPGDRVFARHPHQDLFTMRADPILLFKLPADLQPERAVFANLSDVALNCNLDVPVRHGDCVVVYGQGIVGSLTAQLARRTAGTLIVVDPLAERRELAHSWGADHAVAPDAVEQVVEEATDGRGADICIEATGAPVALQSAIRAAGQEATIAVISFFGGKTVPLVLSPEFHYRRQRIISSQVSTIGSGLQPRWSMVRRMQHVFRLLADPTLQTVVSHTFPFEHAPQAYQLLDQNGAAAMGVLLTYANGP